MPGFTAPRPVSNWFSGPTGSGGRRGFAGSAQTQNWTMNGGRPGEFRDPFRTPNWTMRGGRPGEFRRDPREQERRKRSQSRDSGWAPKPGIRRGATLPDVSDAIAVATIDLYDNYNVISRQDDYEITLDPQVLQAIAAGLTVMAMLAAQAAGVKPVIDVVLALKRIHTEGELTSSNTAQLVSAVASCRNVPSGVVGGILGAYDIVAEQAGWYSSADIFIDPVLNILVKNPPTDEPFAGDRL